MHKQDIREYLKSLPKEDPVYYFPNPGNAGDAIIALATFQLFKETGVNYQILDIDNFEPDGKILIYPDGGNLVNYYGTARDVIGKYNKEVKKLIILPHTINNNDDLIRDLGENTDIILREEVSYDYVKKLNTKSNIMLMDDVAFSLNLDNLPRKKLFPLSKVLCKELLHTFSREHFRSFPKAKKVLWNYRLALYALKRKITGANCKVLNSFRNDCERTLSELPSDNLDLANVFAFGHHNEELAQYTSINLLKYIDNFEQIRTNRLHTCIAAALLNKEVLFYPNSYYKCEAIYNFSIKEYFPNVKWQG